MSLEKGLYGKVEGLSDLASENIVGVQFHHGEQGNSMLTPEDGAEFNSVAEFVQMVDDNGVEGMFDSAENASLRPNPEGDGQVLVLGRNVGSNGLGK